MLSLRPDAGRHTNTALLSISQCAHCRSGAPTSIRLQLAVQPNEQALYQSHMHTAVMPKLRMSMHAYDSVEGSEAAFCQQLKLALSILGIGPREAAAVRSMRWLCPHAGAAWWTYRTGWSQRGRFRPSLCSAGGRATFSSLMLASLQCMGAQWQHKVLGCCILLLDRGTCLLDWKLL